MPATPAVEIDQVTKLFGTHTAVDNLSLTVATGSIYGFIPQWFRQDHNHAHDHADHRS